jgi:hypothetical protein
MKVISRAHHASRWLAPILFALSATIAALTQADGTTREDWKIEPDVENPSYAAVDPSTTNVNIDSVFLACEQAEKRKVLQLQVYLLETGG